MNFLKSIELKQSKKEIIFFLGLLLIAFIFYYPSFLNQNYFWDDERFVFMNPTILQAPHWYSFWNFNSPFYTSWPMGYSMFWSLLHYSPFQTVTFYKSINIFFHTFNAYLLFRFLKRLKFPYEILLTLIFLLHPLCVEPVSWIFQLLTLLAFTFFALSFEAILKFISNKKVPWLFVSLFFFSLSILTKSIALFSPFLFMFLFWHFKMERKFYLLLVPFFLMSLIIGLLNIKGTMSITKQSGSSISNKLFLKIDQNIKPLFPENNHKIEETPEKILFDFNYNQQRKSLDKENVISKVQNGTGVITPLPYKKKGENYIFNAQKVFSQAPWHYFSKLLLPIHLQFIYENIHYPLILNIFALAFFFILPVFLSLKLKNKSFLFLTLIAFLFLVPYIGVTNIGFFYWSNVSDRYGYFLILFLVFLLGLLATKFSTKWFENALVVYALFLGLSTIQHGFKFNRPENLYKEILTYHPHPVIYSLLFEQYLIHYDPPKALQTLNEALSKFPDDPQLEVDKIRAKTLEPAVKIQ